METSGKKYVFQLINFALFEKSHQLFNDIGPEQIRNPHKSEEHAQTLNNYNNTHQFTLSFDPRQNRISNGRSSDTVILNSCFIDYVGVVEISAVENNRFF